MTPFTAWTMARLVAGYEADHDALQHLPERWRPIAGRLADVPADDALTGPDRQAALAEARWPLWTAALAAAPELEAQAKAMEGIDPEGPAPEAHDEHEADDHAWEPLRLGALPPAPPFPLEVLPPPARDLANAAADSIACPVDYPAVAALAAASGMIGRSVVLRVKPGYFATVSLYLAAVGRPSAGKSPALRSALAPVVALAAALYASWRDAMDRWEQTKTDERGEPPELQRLVTSDPTTEALAPILAKNPRGIVVTPDEMTKWVMSMDQYKGGKGGDRPFYLSAWGGEPVFIDRAKNMREPIAVPHPFLTVVGGMTPDMLGTLAEGKGRDDGFLARLLFCYPEPPPRRYSEAGIPEEVADDWRVLLQALWDRTMDDLDGRPAPRIVGFEPEAVRAWSAWCQDHYAEQAHDGFPASLEGPWGKLEAYAARLALLLHLMRLAADPTRDPAAPIPDVPAEALADAFRLVAYFKAHALRVHAAMGGKASDGGDDVRALVGWIVRGGLHKFSARDIRRNFDRFRDDDARLADALDWLVRRNVVRLLPPPASDVAKPGRKPGPSYEVNPTLHSSPRFRHFRPNPAG